MLRPVGGHSPQRRIGMIAQHIGGGRGGHPLTVTERFVSRPRAMPQEVERQRVKAAFLYMMGPGSAANLAQSLGLLHANHRRWHPYKVLVFAPQDVTPKDLSELRVRFETPYPP